MNRRSLSASTLPNAPTRRGFLGAAVGCSVAGLLTPQIARAAASEPDNKRRICTSLKWGMIETAGSVREKFQLVKELGYDGVELVSPAPNLDAKEVRQATDEVGLPVHGVVDVKHWEVRLSSPDPAVRDQGVEHLRQALRDAQAFGGDTVLLVPGKVTGDDETHDDVWQRSIAEIRKVLPLASRLGVRILIENVWNGFCETPEELRDYVDEIASPWVGVYFDIGNAWKFSPSQQWIRTLGTRIVKLDIKGWGQEGGFGKIGEGDVEWPEVRQALEEIRFTGWSTAEVTGGERAELADIVRRMEHVLNLE